MRTYTEAQYSTPSAHAMILGWLGPDCSAADIERVAKYMARSLRIGGIKATRALVLGAISSQAPDYSKPLLNDYGEPGELAEAVKREANS